jgi:ABC-type branched-subunit amino acid transport system ATPase component
MRAAQALGWAGVTPFAYRPPALLNVAQRRRVLLAAALAVVPGLLLLERPCAPLPPSEHAALYATVRELAARWEMVVLLAPDSSFEGMEVLEPQPQPSPLRSGG